MKTTRFNVLTAAILILSAAFIFNGCKKDKDDDVELKCLISTLDISWAEICDDETYSGSSLITLTYDSDDRLSGWAWDDGEQMLFFYSSDGKLHRVEEHWDGKVDELRFTWEGNKVTMQRFYDGGGESSFKRVIEFNNQDEIIRVEGFYKSGSEWEKEWYDVFTWQNGNVMKMEYYSLGGWKKSQQLENNERKQRGLIHKHRLARNRTSEATVIKSSANEFELVYSSTFTYDDKKNPFSIHPGLFTIETDPLFLSQNNVLTWTETSYYDDEDEEYTQNYTWQYNNQNFPSQLVISEVDDWEDCEYSTTILFNYSNCD